MEQSKLSISFTILNWYLIDTDSRVSIIVVDEREVTLLNITIQQSVIFNGATLYLISPIEKILEMMKDWNLYDFSSSKPIIERIDLKLEWDNIHIDSIWIDDFERIDKKFSLQNIQIWTLSITWGRKDKKQVGKLLLIGECKNFIAFYLNLERLFIWRSLNILNVNDLNISEFIYQVGWVNTTENWNYTFISSNIWKIDFSTNDFSKESNDFFKSINFHNCILHNLFLRNINIGSRKMKQEVNKNWLLLIDCIFQKDWLFQSSNSNIEYLEIRNVDNQRINLFNNTINATFVSQSNLEEVSISWLNVGWFYNLWNKSLSNSSIVINNFELKELYRQLKFSHDKIWNKIEANKFFAKEMDYYRKSLIENYIWRTFFDAGIWQKRLICWYNLLTNNFWNSWVRPLLWMVLLVWVATIFQFLNYDWSFDWKQQVLSNILPISEIGEFDTWYSFIYQISWAALIYQFIVALRRISQR